ncbi:hypothetical protein DE4585_04761 [Mycobacteroides salmoniphilum]|uniref:Schlafen AlbA-2 domain-containing protein n=1 Tax=Mycobacteroides salmoniphilum TaxID=404941 RepID=A0A4R8RUD6_9MYCO|nr:ATP-binding protein [Mycobacteroides salmoniphilum]TDZ77367.1 hypothetical protein DE4585_04761 [Mycobacteroides salmoniphilum]
MTFTALHRVLGREPGPLTNELLDQAIAAAVAETDDLDWKSELPAIKGLPQGDVPKDIAAMSNSGGGVIVYGVEEEQKAASARRDAGEFSQEHERAFRSAAVTAISPPVFGLEIHRLGTNPRAIAVVVPASVDGPHLIYRNDYFGAPIRNDADTVWMKERQIEAMYRARFDERRRASDAVEGLYLEAAAGRDSTNRAWLIAVAHPRLPGLARPTRDEARDILKQAQAITLTYSKRDAVHPIESVNCFSPRPGLRRWVAPSTATSQGMNWREAWASVHHDGSVTVAAAVGGHRRTYGGSFEGWEIEGGGIEAVVADFTALVRATAAALHHGEYEVCVGIEWTGADRLIVLTIDGLGHPYEGVSTPLKSYSPVRTTLNAVASDAQFHQEVYELAQDCVNQGGVTHLHVIEQPETEGD